jgi:hypothetical protein
MASEAAIYGLKLGELRGLPAPVKKKLVRQIVRIANTSYQRGFQDGTLGRDSRQVAILPLWRVTDDSALATASLAKPKPRVQSPGGGQKSRQWASLWL